MTTEHPSTPRRPGIVVNSSLIELDDGLLIEVEVPAEHAQPVSGGFAQKVSSAFDQIVPVLRQVCRSFAEACRVLPGSVQLERAELELGLRFEAEGNLYITRSQASANVLVRLTLRPDVTATDGRG